MIKDGTTFVSFKKADDELQIVWGEVYVPDIPDSDGDFMVRDEIRKMAHDFIRGGRQAMVDVQHDNQLYGSAVVESFIVRDDDTLFIPGSWVVGVHIPSDEIWGQVKKGELNGFSMQADARRVRTQVAVSLPDDGIVKGDTSETAGHSHRFEVVFDEKGNFVGGKTDSVGGHVHQIKRGTVTEPAGIDDHTHRFAVVDGLAA